MQLARVNDPPLTTVRQPLVQLGREGAETLLALLDARAPEPLRTLRTDLVLRRSCGCVPTEFPPPADGASEDRAGAAILKGLTAELSGVEGAFARSLDPVLRRLAAGNARELEHNRRLADELSTRLRGAGEDLVHDRMHRLARALELRMFGPQARLSLVLADLLPALGVDACAVSELSPGSKDELKLAFGFDTHTNQPQLVSFSARALLPEGLEELLSGSVVVLPVKYAEEPLGLAVFSVGARPGTFYETLAEVFGIVLKGLSVKRRVP
jgi:hypothetical protein